MELTSSPSRRDVTRGMAEEEEEGEAAVEEAGGATEEDEGVTAGVA